MAAKKIKYIEVGKVGGAHKLNGAFYVHLNEGVLYKKKAITSILIGKEEQGALPFFVKEWRDTREDEVLVSLEEFTTREMARQKQGMKVFVNSACVEIDEDALAPKWVGYAVVDESGFVHGTVSDVKALPGQDLLEFNSGEVKGVLLPIHPDTVPDVDDKLRRITVVLPEGLVDLYRE